MMRVLVVDDEGLARERITMLLQGREGIDVVGESPDGLQAVEDILQLKPDVVFLDVQMPGLDGFEVIAALDPREVPVVVFVTAYDEYALEAFEAHAIDYLLKPIDPERFEEALGRAQRMLRGEDRKPLPESLTSRGSRTDRLVGRRGSSFIVVPHGEIMRIEAAGNYLRVVSPEGECLVRSTMKAMETRLDPSCFMRVHRSAIIALAHVRSVDSLGHGEYEVVMSDGKRLKSNRAQGPSLRRALGL